MVVSIENLFDGVGRTRQSSRFSDGEVTPLPRLGRTLRLPSGLALPGKQRFGAVGSWCRGRKRFQQLENAAAEIHHLRRDDTVVPRVSAAAVWWYSG
jgi:hypothetical protein